MIKQLVIKTINTQQVIDLTDDVQKFLTEVKNQDGSCTIFVQHTTCAITTGEMGEGTEDDLLEVLKNLIPSIQFRHIHNPTHAWTHMAASLLGTSLTIPFIQGKLATGKWQSILLVELDGPRERKVMLSINY